MRFTDPDLKYCPRCDDEYREDMTTCAACEVTLITGSEKIAQEQKRDDKLAARSMELSSDDNLANIRKGPLGEMKQLQTVLAAEKIPSLIVSTDQNGRRGRCHGSSCP